jgi:hypothetical protein
MLTAALRAIPPWPRKSQNQSAAFCGLGYIPKLEASPCPPVLERCRSAGPAVARRAHKVALSFRRIPAMLWGASSIRGYAVVATDGTSGTVADFIFEDQGWTIKWLVVETGAWFSGRRLFVPVSAFEHPDPETREFSLSMTLAELADCPGRDLAELSDAETGAHFTEADMAGNQTTDGGPHFRSLAVMHLASIEAADGEVGHAEDFLIDSADWQIKYLVVDTSDWWFGEKILISTRAITGIDTMHHVVTLDATRQFVKDGARFSPEQTVDGAFDESFETYFGIRFVKK